MCNERFSHFVFGNIEIQVSGVLICIACIKGVEARLSVIQIKASLFSFYNYRFEPCEIINLTIMSENCNDMSSSTLKQKLHLKRNETKERMSMSSFIDYFYQNLDSNNKKGGTTVFLQLLDTIVASCDLSENETPESKELLNANNFFCDIQTRIKNKDYKPSIILTDVSSYITALGSLKQEAVKYDDSLYICNRIDSFVSELNNIVTNIYNNEQQKNKRKNIIYTIIVLLVAFFFARDCSCSCDSNSIVGTYHTEGWGTYTVDDNGLATNGVFNYSVHEGGAVDNGDFYLKSIDNFYVCFDTKAKMVYFSLQEYRTRTNGHPYTKSK